MNLFSPENLISLLSLSAMEIVLGIDNIIFIAILSQKLPDAHQQKKARRLGLALALLMRLGLLFTVSTIMKLTRPLFEILGQGLSGRDLVLILGGLFLIGKSATEIYEKVEGDPEEHQGPGGKRASFTNIIIQILLLDMVFSLDSVVTAVGMVPHLWIMVVAMIIAVGVMLVFADPISNFVMRHPSMKILALSFLLLIGVLLVAEGFGQHISKGYVYFAMAFSVFIEVLNMRFRKKRPLELHSRFKGPATGG
jgi:predicted tellurium resistance membrane protein TerC